MSDTLISVSQDGSRLVTEGDLTLYYFTPQRFNPTHNGPTPESRIPWMADFPFYLKDWIEDWSPLIEKPIVEDVVEDAAKQKRKQNNGISKSDFRTFRRNGGPKKDEIQIMFRGWYLYTYKGDGPNQINGEVNGIWQKVTPDLISLKHYLSAKDGPGPIEDYLAGP